MTRTPANVLQRKCKCGQPTAAGTTCAACKDEDKGTLRRKATGPATGEVPPIVYDVLREPGTPLDAGTRAYFEPRFGADFGSVRVHTGARAAQAAESVNAAAFAVGRHVAFGSGEFQPQSAGGRELMAHELAHTQQQPATVNPASGLRIDDNPTAEAEAERAGQAATHDGDTISLGTTAAAGIQRQPAGAGDAGVTACKNQSAVDAIIAANPLKYPAGVTMYTHVIVSGDRLENLARATAGDNTVHVVEHYINEIKALNKSLKTDRIGNCAILLRGWTDPQIGTLPAVAAGPGAGVLPISVIQAIATVYAEQTGTSASAQLQQKYIWFSMRRRLELGMHGPDLDDVLKKGGYYGMGKPDYLTAIADLANPMPNNSTVLDIMTMIQSNYTNAIPADAGPYYFHWRHGSTPEKCFQNLGKKKASADRERKCAWEYADANGFTKNVTQSQGWSKQIRGDSAPPSERFGTMYIYTF